MQVLLQRRRGHLEHIFEKKHDFYAKGTSMTETLGNDCTQTKV